MWLASASMASISGAASIRVRVGKPFQHAAGLVELAIELGVEQGDGRLRSGSGLCHAVEHGSSDFKNQVTT
jgi:hypothetical protein